MNAKGPKAADAAKAGGRPEDKDKHSRVRAAVRLVTICPCRKTSREPGFGVRAREQPPVRSVVARMAGDMSEINSCGILHRAPGAPEAEQRLSLLHGSVYRSVYVGHKVARPVFQRIRWRPPPGALPRPPASARKASPSVRTCTRASCCSRSFRNSCFLCYLLRGVAAQLRQIPYCS